MELKHLIIFLLLNLTEVFGIIKETIKYDANGGIIRRVTSSESEVKQCYRYTWMGPVTETTNQTSNCLDFQDEEAGQTRPCFEPLVWTFNDDNGDNEPNLEELEAVCQEKGCDPFCTPSPSQTCVKYTEWNGDTLSYVSKFCGKVTLDWNRNKGDVNRCFRENNKEYCFCDQNMKYKCNTATRTVSQSLSSFLAIVLISFFM